MKGYQEINEIDLIDLMFYCLKRWRLIVVGMVVFGILAGVYKYQATIDENLVKREEQMKQEMAEPVEGEAEVESEPIVFEDPLSSAVKFGIVGMIGGVCLVCLMFSISYIMSGKRKIFGFVDRWICRLEEGPYAKITRNEQIKIAAVNIQATIHRNTEEKIRRVMLAGTITSDDVIEICERLAEEIGDVTFSPYRQIVFHATALKKLEYYDGIVFVEKKEESYEKLIRQEIELALDRDIKVLGAILC